MVVVSPSISVVFGGREKARVGIQESFPGNRGKSASGPGVSALVKKQQLRAARPIEDELTQSEGDALHSNDHEGHKEVVRSRGGAGECSPRRRKKKRRRSKMLH